MQRASSDTVRLILLVAASTVSRGVRSFVDDTRVPIFCHGHVVAALQVLDVQASKEQYRYKSDKCKVIAHNFGQRRPFLFRMGLFSILNLQFSWVAVLMYFRWQCTFECYIGKGFAEISCAPGPN